MPAFQDLTGRRFNRFLVLDRRENSKRSLPRWLCVCDCGTFKIVLGQSLTSGKSKSCRCYRDEVRERVFTKHGQSRQGKTTTEFISWVGILDRCNNVNNHAYKNYGGRGITICEEWENSFETFFADMGMKPNKNYSLDRIDNSKGYSKDNCRWASRRQQNRNRRNNHSVEYQGINYTSIAEFSEKFNCIYYKIQSRIARSMDLSQAIKESQKQIGEKV